MATYTKRDYYNTYVNNEKSKGRTNIFPYEKYISNPNVLEAMEGLYFDDDYLAEIEQYKNKSWYNYLLTNPWLAGNQSQFSPNAGQSIMSGLFGDNSARDKYNSELRSYRSQWLSEALEKFRQQEYNEPIEQVAREQTAGMNADLVGNIDSGQAAENDQPLLGHPSFGEPVNLSQIGSFFMDIYSLASGFAKDSVSMQMMMNDLKSQDLDLNNKVVGVTNEFIKGHTALGTVTTEDGSIEYHVIPPDDDLISDYAKKNFKSRSLRKKFINEVKSSYASGRSNAIRFGSVASGQEAKYNASRVIGRNEAFGDNEFDPMIIVEKSLSKMDRDIREYQSKYTSDYFHKASGEKAGEAVNKQNQGIIDENEARSYQRGMDKIVNATMERIVHKLEQSSKNGGLEGLIAEGMLGFISAYRLQMLPSLPSVNLQGLVQQKNFNTNNNYLQD